MVTSDSAKANLFNQYFVSVFTKEDVSNVPKLHLPMVAGFTFDHLSVSPSDVCAELSALDTSKACGPDGSSAELRRMLQNLLSNSLADGVLPLDWVHANITPVFKKGNIAIID